MKVLHILYQSLPQISGSSIRSRDILLSQKEIGLEVLAVTSPFQNSLGKTNPDPIDGISYWRTGASDQDSDFGMGRNLSGKFKRLFSIIPFYFKLNKLVKEQKPDVLHAHAMFFCFIPAWIIARRHKIPIVYEFRSLWMLDMKDGKQKKGAGFAGFWLRLEAALLKRADFAIFLNHNLKNYFTERNYAFPHAEVIENAVNTSYIDRLKRDLRTATTPNRLNFGYIGTLTSYEGIEFMIEAFRELYEEGNAYNLIIYGDGEEKDAIKKKLEERSDMDSIRYLGRISPEHIPEAYGEIDVIVNPRLKSEITDSVTPMKPLEAMAYGKLYLGSDVKGILEIISPGENGLTFKADDKESLKAAIKSIAKMDLNKRTEIEKRALDYVQNNKSWRQNASKYEDIYKSLISSD